MKENTLKKIREWDWRDPFNLLDFIYAIFHYQVGVKRKWIKDEIDRRWVLSVEIHTSEWGDNEAIIDALLSNKMFVDLWYERWERG